MGRRPGRSQEGGVALWARARSIVAFESFVDRLDFLSKRERDRVKIAGSEILDNIIRHASPVFHRRLRVRVKGRADTILLAFYFRAPGFAAFSVGNNTENEPLFDPKGRRWRGLGLVMCQNLSSKISFRPGERMDRIFLEFGRDDPASFAIVDDAGIEPPDFSVPLTDGNHG